MQTLKDDIRNRILQTAEEHFLRKGFLKTSMREIADIVGIGVGNIYNYFSGKNELFRMVVRPVVSAFEQMLQLHHGQRCMDVGEMLSESYFRKAVDEYLCLINTHRRLMKILLFRSQGSSLEHFREEFTDRTTEVVRGWFEKVKSKYPEARWEVSDFTIHLHTVWEVHADLL